ncbi:MAG: hypothetical protein ACYC3S_02620 [Chloroflexota bacterium]
MEQAIDTRAFEVFAWGYGYVGARATLCEAQSLARDYEGARIITYEGGAFRVVAELGRYAALRQAK